MKKKLIFFIRSTVVIIFFYAFRRTFKALESEIFIFPLDIGDLQNLISFKLNALLKEKLDVMKLCQNW